MISDYRDLNYANKDSDNDIHNEINKIRIQIFEISPYLNKKVLYDIRKRLHYIEKLTKINRTEKNKLTK